MKKKKETFFFIQVTHKEDKLVEFSFSFYSEEDFATGFVVRLYLLLEI